MRIENKNTKTEYQSDMRNCAKEGKITTTIKPSLHTIIIRISHKTHIIKVYRSI